MSRDPQIYMDYASTTPVDPRVVEAMLPFFDEMYANPSSVHAPGQTVRNALDEARANVAALIGASPAEIIFTSGGTEADNLALKGAMEAAGPQAELITSAVEHHAVLDSAAWLQRQGYRVEYLGVDQQGRVDPADVAGAVSDHTALVSIMTANNEIGTVQPVRAVVDAVEAAADGVMIHTDAVQAAGLLPLDVDELGVDLCSVSSHKIYGPKGVGALFVREGSRLAPLLHGGSQERKRRPGTENVPGIIGFGKAAALAREEREVRAGHVRQLQSHLIDGLLTIDESRLNGPRRHRLPNNVNVSFKGLDGEALLLSLSEHGIAASAASACTSGAVEPSHVLEAIGLAGEWSEGTVRFSLGVNNDVSEVERVCRLTAERVEHIRSVSFIESER